MNLVGGADEDEGGEDDVENGIFGQQHQHPVSVSRQPNVVLGDEQLQRDFPEPSEEGRIPRPKPP